MTATLRELGFHWHLFLVALLYCWSGMPACGQAPFDSVGRIQVGMSACGSCTLVDVNDGNGMVLTASHLWDDGGGQIKVTFPATGVTYMGKLLGLDTSKDLAAVEIQQPAGIQPTGVATAKQEDSPFTAAGYPYFDRQRLHKVTGEYLGFPQQDSGQKCWNPSTVHVRGVIVSGYSGGAVFNRNGQFCGVACGTTAEAMGMPEDRFWAPSGEALMAFVNRWPTPTLTQCINGQCSQGWQPASQPGYRVVTQPVQPQQPAPNQPASYTDPQWVEWRKEIEASIAAGKCQCDHSQDVTKEEFAALQAQVVTLAGSVESIAQANATISQTIENIHQYVPPAPQEQAAAIAPHLPPFYFSIEDARGFSKPAKPVRLGQELQLNPESFKVSGATAP